MFDGKRNKVNIYLYELTYQKQSKNISIYIKLSVSFVVKDDFAMYKTISETLNETLNENMPNPLRTRIDISLII